jgi:hypothetical protein
MKPDEMGLMEKAALVVSNLAFLATLGFGACLMITRG